MVDWQWDTRSQLTQNSIVFWIFFSGWLCFRDLYHMSRLNNYMLEDTCWSRWVRSFCSGCHHNARRRWLSSLHIHMRGRMCSHFTCLLTRTCYYQAHRITQRLTRCARLTRRGHSGSFMSGQVASFLKLPSEFLFFLIHPLNIWLKERPYIKVDSWISIP